MKEDVREKLNVLGSEGVLDMLICVKKQGWATASEVADSMGTHVATAVKRLNMLYEIEYLERRTRKGKTRSALEYSLRHSRFIIELDLEEDAETRAGNAESLGALLRDILARMERFGGKNRDVVLRDWKKIPGLNEKVIIWLECGDAEVPDIKPQELVDGITAILAAEASEYGELTLRALVRAALEAVMPANGRTAHELTSKFFGGE